MSAKSVVSAVVGFLTHHVTDLNNVSSVLSELVSVAPLDSQDKERIASVIETVQASADNIVSFLENNTVTDANGDVVVKESDIVAALANFLASDAGKSALADAVKGVAPPPASTEGNVNNG